MAKTGDYPIPFDKQGNQQHYAEVYQLRNGSVVMKDNYVFVDKLRFVGYERGRSAAYFTFQDSNGKEVTMFLKEFEAVVPHMIQGLVAGSWTFIKRGMNYGVRLVKPWIENGTESI